MVSQQWDLYQLEDIEGSLYTIVSEDKWGSNRPSYIQYALQSLGLEPIDDSPSTSRRIDHYWRDIGDIHTEGGMPHYHRLIAWEFWKRIFIEGLLDSHGNNMSEGTIQTQRFIKDALHCAGGGGGGSNKTVF